MLHWENAPDQFLNEPIPALHRTQRNVCAVRPRYRRTGVWCGEADTPLKNSGLENGSVHRIIVGWQATYGPPNILVKPATTISQPKSLEGNLRNELIASPAF